MSRFFTAPLIPVLICIAVIFLFLFFTRKKYNVLFLGLTVICFILLGMLRVAQVQELPENHINHFTETAQTCTFEGTIVSPVRVMENRQQCHVWVDSLWIDFKPRFVQSKIVLNIYANGVVLEYGDRLCFRGKVLHPTGPRNPGSFDYKTYLAAQGVHTVVSVSNKNEIVKLGIDGGNRFYANFIMPVRRYVLNIIGQNFNAQNSSLLQGLLLGLTDDMEPADKELFSNAGVMHVFAVSGLHVGFVLLALSFLFGILRIPKTIAIVLTLAGLVYFACLTGGKPPVVRAVIMAGVYLIGKMLRRNVMPVNVLAISALVILMVNPLDLFTVSFQLSFAAVSGIVLVYQRIYTVFKNYFIDLVENGNRFQLRLVQLFILSFSAQIATLPLVIYYWGKVPVLSVLANIFIVPLVMIVVFVSMAGMVINLVVPFFSDFFFGLGSTGLHLINIFIQFINHVPFSHFKCAQPSLFFFVVYVFSVIILLNFNNKVFQKTGVWGFLFFINFFIWKSVLLNEPGLTVTFFDVGQGDAALLSTNSGEHMLVDTGPKTDFTDVGEYIIAPYLKRQGIKRLHTVVISHNHEDHSGGLEYLTKNFSIGRIVCARDSTKNLSDTVPVQTVSTGDTLCGLTNTECYILHPIADFIKSVSGDENEQSVILKIVYGKHSFLFTGDVEAKSENCLNYYKGFLKSDVLKVPHHGSRTSSSQNFIEYVNSQYAVISLKKGNRFGFPDSATINRYQKINSTILRTDENGAIVFKTNGKELKRVR